MLFAIFFNLDQCKILSSGNGLIITQQSGKLIISSEKSSENIVQGENHVLLPCHRLIIFNYKYGRGPAGVAEW